MESMSVRREQLAQLSRGGSARWAIAVPSASVIEGRAASLPCPQCGGENRIHDHVRPFPGLRRVDVTCRMCGAPRVLWFRIVEQEPN
jgi:hypothetical protein